MSRRHPQARHPLWERRLHDYLIAVAGKAHDYGEHDCLLHPASGVEAVTGIDPAAEHRGQYRSEASAVRYLHSLGFESPEQLLDSLFDEGPVGFAQRGDIVLTPPDAEGGWGVPGIVSGENAHGEAVAAVIVAGEVNGLCRIARRHWTKAWKVGR